GSRGVRSRCCRVCPNEHRKSTRCERVAGRIALRPALETKISLKEKPSSESQKPAGGRTLTGFCGPNCRCLNRLKASVLEHHLDATDDFIELVLAKLRIGLAEIRPGVNVVDHQLEIVAVDVVVEAAGDGVDSVVALLPRIQVLPLNGRLKLFRDQEKA